MTTETKPTPDLFNAYVRMCKSCDGCFGCEIFKQFPAGSCASTLSEHYDECVRIIADWADAHPAKSRADRFRELYPDSRPELIRPCYITNIQCEHIGSSMCYDCQNRYWEAPYEN